MLTANILYGLFLVGLARAVPAGLSGTWPADRTGVVDTITVSLSALLLVWVLLIRPAGTELSAINNPALLSYPIADVLLTRHRGVALLTGRRYSPAVAYLAGGVLCELVADVMHGIAARAGGWPAEATANVGWLVPLAWGCPAPVDGPPDRTGDVAGPGDHHPAGWPCWRSPR